MTKCVGYVKNQEVSLHHEDDSEENAKVLLVRLKLVVVVLAQHESDHAKAYCREH